jgi:hypothetical protein
MCAKCKLQLSEHLFDHQVQNNAKGIEISEHVNCAINCQCNRYISNNLNTPENSSDAHKFDNFSNDLIKIQQALHDSENLITDNENLIKIDDDELSDNLIKVDNEFFN